MRAALSLTRRDALGALAASTALAVLRSIPGLAQAATVLTRPIPSSGEALPLVGLGSWITFNVGDDVAGRDSCAEVMRAFFAGGGRMIDSSPMYGSSQEVIGYGLEKLAMPPSLFAATKVWISSGSEGPAQIEASRASWTVPRFDLLLVHNLLAWEEHLQTLFAMKSQGQVRYVGVTTSHGRRHDELEQIMSSQPLDFIQVTYNIQDREIEDRILPLAAERRIGVIINRPFQGGDLFPDVEGHPLPDWSAQIGATSWAQFLLKFIISHPAVTCAIPATTRVDHVEENLRSASEPLPDAATRARMIEYFEQL
jgi:diketogulonate reductase-like aldo/keto reductase